MKTLSTPRPRHTRIVATIGPASRDPSVLKHYWKRGGGGGGGGGSMFVESTAPTPRPKAFDRMSRAFDGFSQLGRNIGILLDLQGPKIRTGKIDPPIKLVAGDQLTVVMDADYQVDGHRIGTTWTRMDQDVAPGEMVLFADGALAGEVSAVRSNTEGLGEVDIEIHQGGLLGSHKGINLPESNIQAPALTAKDRADLVVGVRAGVDFVALSFVRTADDIQITYGRHSTSWAEKSCPSSPRSKSLRP